MALFYIFGRIDTGSCSQTPRPLTHQSKELLCSAAPHHTKLISLPLSLHLLCAPSPTSFSELILLHKMQFCLDSLPFSAQSFSDLPTLSLSSHSLFLFNVLLPCLHLHPLPLYPLQLRFSFLSFQTELQKAGSYPSVILQTKQNAACSQAAF